MGASAPFFVRTRVDQLRGPTCPGVVFVATESRCRPESRRSPIRSCLDIAQVERAGPPRRHALRPATPRALRRPLSPSVPVSQSTFRLHSLDPLPAPFRLQRTSEAGPPCRRDRPLIVCSPRSWPRPLGAESVVG